MLNKNEFGSIEISNKAINDIANICVEKTKGVYPNKKDGTSTCNFKDDELRIVVSVKIKQGIDVVKTCNNLQSKIKAAIGEMTGIEAKSVDIEIQGFVSEK